MDPALPLPSQFPSITMDETEVRNAVLSFPAGSPGGTDGLRPQHLRDLLPCRESGSDFLSALTAFVNMVLAGHCAPEAACFFFGGRLLALKKKIGGIRPIAVGFTLRLLASKCASTCGASWLSSYLSPRQLGVGVPGRCEAAIHSARRYLETLPPDHVFVKLDYSNAFNSLHRCQTCRAPWRTEFLTSMLSVILRTIFLVPWFLYGLFPRGPPSSQQGDPLAPLLFCNTIHPLLQSLEANLSLGFLDDLSLGGLESVVADDVSKIIKEGADHPLWV